MFLGIILIAAFFALLLGIGLWSKKFVSNASDYLLAGREMSGLINMMGIVATGFAGTAITLSPSLAMTYGMWGCIAFACTYAFVGVILFGVLFAKPVRFSGAYTQPEWLEMRYDYRVRRVLSISGLLGLIGATATNVLAMGNVISGYFGIDIKISVAIGVVAFMIFTVMSGMWGVSLTDLVQSLIGCVGAPLLIILCITTFGSFGDNAAAFSEISGKSWFWFGLSGTQLNTGAIVYPSLLTMALNFGVFLVWGNQGYWIRLSGARNWKQARLGYIIGGILLATIIICIGTVGIFTGASMPELFTLAGGENAPTSAYGLALSKFPTAAGAFLLIFALAASLSTCASVLMASVNTATKDIYPLFNKHASDEQTKRFAKIATVVISLIAWGLSYYPQGTTFLFAFSTAWMAPSFIMFVLGQWRRITATGAFVGALCALTSMTIFSAMDLFKVDVAGKLLSGYCHMSIVGLLFGVIPAVIVSYCTKPKYYGESTWKVKGESKVTCDLTDVDKKVLELIRRGHNVMSELFDLLRLDGGVLNKSIEKLDENRYIERKGLAGGDFWTFNLTEKGESVLPATSGEDEKLEAMGISQYDVELLQACIKAGKGRATEIIVKMTDDEQKKVAYAGSVVKLVRLGYLNESGILKRIVEVNENGKALLNRI